MYLQQRSCHSFFRYFGKEILLLCLLHQKLIFISTHTAESHMHRTDYSAVTKSMLLHLQWGVDDRTGQTQSWRCHPCPTQSVKPKTRTICVSIRSDLHLMFPTCSLYIFSTPLNYCSVTLSVEIMCIINYEHYNITWYNAVMHYNGMSTGI